MLGKHDIYDRFRSWPVHGYLVKGNSKIVIEGGNCGTEFDDKTGIFTFYVRKYLEDLKFAVNQYVYELHTDLEKFNRAKSALENKAQLL